MTPALSRLRAVIPVTTLQDPRAAGWSGQNSGREWDSLIKPGTSLIADLNSLQGRIIFVRMRRELASNRFGIEVIPAFRGEKVSERVAAE